MEIIEGARIPIWSWASDLEQGALDQARTLANLRPARHHIALMPDAQPAYSMPVGGVLFTENAVVPYAIGIDIGCGVMLAKTNLIWEDTLTPEKLRNVLRQLSRDVPTGINKHKQPIITRDRLLALMGSDLPERNIINPSWFEAALFQAGTMGGNNHFQELQRDPETNQVYFMLHSGSRAFGKNICEHHARVAKAWCRRQREALVDEELAWLPLDSDEGQAYFEAMEFGLRWAEVNRRLMMDAAERALRKHASVHTFTRLTGIHHNYAAQETHYGIAGVVHRKGAVHAGHGELVLVPGSMGTASYLAEGLGAEASFITCQHGAGRALSRNAAKKRKSAEETKAEMREWGIEYITGRPEDSASEAAFAYRSVDAVMAASADLVRPLRRLVPLGVIKA